MSMSLEAAAQAMREAMRETVKRHSLWYLMQGILMVLGGILALIYPLVSSVAVVLFLGWVCFLKVRVRARAHEDMCIRGQQHEDMCIRGQHN
jgi:hypothetical protein